MQTCSFTTSMYLAYLYHTIHTTDSTYNMTVPLDAPNQTTYLYLSATLHSTHRHTRLETTRSYLVWQSSKSLWHDKLLGTQPLATVDPTYTRSVELFDFHLQKCWPAQGQCHYSWPLLNKVTDYGMHQPSPGFMITSQTTHTSLLLIFLHSIPGICGATQAFLFTPAPWSAQINYFWHLMANSRKKEWKKAVWLFLPLSSAYFQPPSSTHYCTPIWTHSLCMFSSHLALPLAPAAAQLTGPVLDSSMQQRPQLRLLVPQILKVLHCKPMSAGHFSCLVSMGLISVTACIIELLSRSFLRHCTARWACSHIACGPSWQVVLRL